jgi:hypothetical protein
MQRTLFATAEPVLDGSILSDALPGAGAQAVHLLTGQASLDAVLSSGLKYSGAVVACGSGKASISPSFLGGVAKLLQPGARATVQLGGVAQQVRDVPCTPALHTPRMHASWRAVAWGMYSAANLQAHWPVNVQ